MNASHPILELTKLITLNCMSQKKNWFLNFPLDSDFDECPYVQVKWPVDVGSLHELRAKNIKN